MPFFYQQITDYSFDESKNAYDFQNPHKYTLSTQASNQLEAFRDKIQLGVERLSAAALEAHAVLFMKAVFQVLQQALILHLGSHALKTLGEKGPAPAKVDMGRSKLPLSHGLKRFER